MSPEQARGVEQARPPLRPLGARRRSRTRRSPASSRWTARTPTSSSATCARGASCLSERAAGACRRRSTRSSRAPSPRTSRDRFQSAAEFVEAFERAVGRAAARRRAAATTCRPKPPASEELPGAEVEAGAGAAKRQPRGRAALVAAAVAALVFVIGAAGFAWRARAPTDARSADVGIATVTAPSPRQSAPAAVSPPGDDRSPRRRSGASAVACRADPCRLRERSGGLARRFR